MHTVYIWIICGIGIGIDKRNKQFILCKQNYNYSNEITYIIATHMAYGPKGLYKLRSSLCNPLMVHIYFITTLKLSAHRPHRQ